MQLGHGERVTYNRTRLFWTSSLALCMAGIAVVMLLTGGEGHHRHRSVGGREGAQGRTIQSRRPPQQDEGQERQEGAERQSQSPGCQKVALKPSLARFHTPAKADAQHQIKGDRLGDLLRYGQV